MSFFLAIAAKKKVTLNDFVSAGGRYSVSIQNGRAWGWGYNNNGQVGNNAGGTNQCALTPVSVLGSVKTFCKISAGEASTAAIDKYGRAWGWGRNVSGQLGDNSVVSRLTPVSVLGSIKTFCHISASLGAHTMAIDKYGRVWGWGTGSNGRLGTNSITDRSTPVSVAGSNKTFCKISAGNAWTAAIDKYGRVWCWGNGGDGRLGTGSTVSALTPVSVIGSTKTFCHIGTGNATTAAIDKYGKIWSWGFNNSGQLGNGANVAQCTPVALAGATKTFCKISLSNGQTLALDKYGRAWGWGFNAAGLIGDNSVTARNTPVSVAGAAKTFCEIAAGSQHALAIDKYGNTWAWGPNVNILNGNGIECGQLGAKIRPFVTTPKSIIGATKTFCSVAPGNTHCVGLDKNGRLWAWGQNTNGRIGDNTTTARYTPISVLGSVKTFCQITSGANYTLAIAKNGRVWSWGANNNGFLGDNSTTSRLTPVNIAGSTKTFCKIFAASAHSLAIEKNGRAWGWGNQQYGSLGNQSDAGNALTPVSVRGAVKTFCEITGGVQFSIAIDKNGRAWGWGYNYSGQIGNVDFYQTTVNTPVYVSGAIKTFCKIAAGDYHCIAIDKYGTAWGWGYGQQGQLGDGMDSVEFSPVQVFGSRTFCQIAAGWDHSVAIDKNGRVWGWGNNSSGQLGIGTTPGASTPVSIAGATKTFCKIYVRMATTLGIDKYGKAWGWGANYNGQLSIQPENAVVLTPVRVCNI